jgi:hypothetical protein
VGRWDYRRGDNTAAGPDRPSRLTDVAVALLFAVVDSLALAGMVLWIFLMGMSHSEPPTDPAATTRGVPVLLLALTWVVPGALAVSTFVHTRLRMPVTATVQGLFFLGGTLLAIGGTNMLFSLA